MTLAGRGFNIFLTVSTTDAAKRVVFWQQILKLHGEGKSFILLLGDIFLFVLKLAHKRSRTDSNMFWSLEGLVSLTGNTRMSKPHR